MTLEEAMGWMMTGYIVTAGVLIVGWWIHKYNNKKGKQ
jgi:hypothetical protein